MGVCFGLTLIKIYTVAQLDTFYLASFFSPGKAVWGIKECIAFSVFAGNTAAVILLQLPLLATKHSLVDAYMTWGETILHMNIALAPDYFFDSWLLIMYSYYQPSKMNVEAVKLPTFPCVTTDIWSQFVARHIFYWRDARGKLLSDGRFPTALCRLKGLEKSTIYLSPEVWDGALFVWSSKA